MCRLSFKFPLRRVIFVFARRVVLWFLIALFPYFPPVVSIMHLLISCDDADAVPLRKIPLNKVPFVPNNEPLLGILDKFQEGRSHMAIVSRFSVDKVGWGR